MTGEHGTDVQDHEDDTDLSDIPMDEEERDEDLDEDEDEDEDDERSERPQQSAADKPPLPAAELEKRYSNSRVALAEERRTRKALERELETYRRGGEQPAGRQRQEERRAEPEAEIDPEEDPIGALRQLRAKVAAYEAAERQEAQTAEQRQAQDRAFAQVEEALGEHEAVFREDHPDYDEAAKHYATTRAQELLSFGLKPAQVQLMLREEFANLAATAIRAKKNPAAVVYEMAKGRGYGAAADPGGEVKGGKRTGGGKIADLARGARASSPMARSGGRPANGLDAATVANINIRDKRGAAAFDAAWEKMEAEAKAAERGR